MLGLNTEENRAS